MQVCMYISLCLPERWGMYTAVCLYLYLNCCLLTLPTEMDAVIDIWQVFFLAVM